VKAPEKSPNVVIVLIDDQGFGQSSAFGGPISEATLDKLAASGLKYNRFHTTALSSPTRVALLTGRNHHLNNAGAIMELATGFPGNTGVRPNSVAPMAEMLRLNGYSTAAFGKYHETAPWEVSVSGPFDRCLPVPASTSFMALLAVKQISGLPQFMMAPYGLKLLTIQTIILLPT
jgi:arylsulfatase